MPEPKTTPQVIQTRVVLTTSDFERAVAFYRDGLGLEQLADFSNEHGHGLVLDAGHATVEILDAGHAGWVDTIEVGRHVGLPVRIAFQVPEPEAVATAIGEEQTMSVFAPAMTPWNSLNVRIEAPDGMQLTLFTELD